MIWYMVYLLTAIGLPPSGSSRVHIYTKQYIKQQNRHKQYTEQQYHDKKPYHVSDFPW